MRLPEVKNALHDLANDNRLPSEIAARINALAAEISRRKPKNIAAPSCAKATPELRQQIRDFAKKYPAFSQLAISKKFNVNPGRVSEALRGFRD